MATTVRHAEITLATMEAIERVSATAYAELCRRAYEVLPLKDLRGRIDVVVDMREHPEYSPEVIAHAIGFMTGSVGRFEMCASGAQVARFVSDGYRAGPCGDH